MHLKKTLHLQKHPSIELSISRAQGWLQTPIQPSVCSNWGDDESNLNLPCEYSIWYKLSSSIKASWMNITSRLNPARVIVVLWIALLHIPSTSLNPYNSIVLVFHITKNMWMVSNLYTTTDQNLNRVYLRVISRGSKCTRFLYKLSFTIKGFYGTVMFWEKCHPIIRSWVLKSCVEDHNKLLNRLPNKPLCFSMMISSDGVVW